MTGKLTAIAYCAKTTPLFAFIALIVACSRDSRANDMQRCIAEVQRKTTQGQLSYLLSDSDSGEVRHDKIGGVVSDCMEKLGYGHTNREMADERCVDDVDFNPYCYRR